MHWQQRIKDVQRHLREGQIDGWLLYDFSGQNPLAREFLKLPFGVLTTRRFFYWIPAQGEPIQLLHQIEPHVLEHLPGKKMTYLKWQELEAVLRTLLSKSQRVAMEYSPRGHIPYLSKVDAGIVELVRSCGPEVVSSGDFLQHYTCVLDEEQLDSHLAACAFLDQTAAKTWEMVATCLRTGKKMTAYGVRQFILQEFTSQGFTTEGLPICALNAHTADPHFEPYPEDTTPITQGDFLLIDLWCKKNTPRAVYGDITRVAVADTAATPRQTEIFQIVRRAQAQAAEYVTKKWKAQEAIHGYEVDQVARQAIEEAGYGPFFIHRTGHNIYTSDHGPGAHLDSLETKDERLLIPCTCFSIEPGIYLPGEFGIRLEYDVYLAPDRTLQITGGVQERVRLLL